MIKVDFCRIVLTTSDLFLFHRLSREGVWRYPITISLSSYCPRYYMEITTNSQSIFQFLHAKFPLPDGTTPTCEYFNCILINQIIRIPRQGYRREIFCRMFMADLFLFHPPCNCWQIPKRLNSDVVVCHSPPATPQQSKFLCIYNPLTKWVAI